MHHCQTNEAFNHDNGSGGGRIAKQSNSLAGECLRGGFVFDFYMKRHYTSNGKGHHSTNAVAQALLPSKQAFSSMKGDLRWNEQANG